MRHVGVSIECDATMSEASVENSIAAAYRQVSTASGILNDLVWSLGLIPVRSIVSLLSVDAY
jgi:hypothetical protein